MSSSRGGMKHPTETVLNHEDVANNVAYRKPISSPNKVRLVSRAA